ncbi:MAG: hypothetical protein AAB074_17050 [Planctomycetota bacterium]
MDDVGVILDIDAESAPKALRRLGVPLIRVGRRLACRAADLRAALDSRAQSPPPRPDPRPLPPHPNDALLAELRRKPRFLKGGGK